MTRRAAILLGAGLALCAAGAAAGLEAFLRSWLLGFSFWIAIPLGALAVLMLHDLSGGAWGEAVRPHLEAAARTVPLFAALALPFLVGFGRLYGWSHPGHIPDTPAMWFKSAWLSAPFFHVRAAFYLAAWIGLAWAVASRARAGVRSEAVAGPGLILYGLTMTFAAVDWILSLDPHHSSTMFPVVIMVGQVLAALAFAIVVATRAAPSVRPEPDEGRATAAAIDVEALHDLGKLLFAFVLLWAYVSFSQYLIVWSANLLEEIPWYVRRLRGGWEAVAVALIAVHFALPFAALLSRRTKRSARALGAIAALVLAMRLVDLFWHIAPEGGGHGNGLLVRWTDVGVPLGMGGIWLSAFEIGGGALVGPPRGEDRQ